MANENYDSYENRLPVFLINGFLEAGKSDFIKFTMQQEYFQTEGTTLLLLCEEGESEYDPAFLERYHTKLIRMEHVTDFNEQHLTELEHKFRPERILIEWNGVWKQDDLYDGPMSEKVLAEQQGRAPEYQVAMPAGWMLYQVITIMDGQTLGMYLGNNDMKSFMGQMTRRAELIIVNRADDISQDNMVDYRRKLRAMGQNAVLIFEGKDGEIPQDTLPEELPYSLDSRLINIKPSDYGIWFVDCMDHPKRYLGKTVSFTAMILKRKQMPANEFIPGRMAMTCCAQDMTFLGFVCKGDPAELSAFATRDWAKINARVDLEQRPEYHGEGPVLELQTIARTGAIEEPVSF